MKKLYLRTLLVLVSGLLAFTACTTDETSDVSPAAEPETVDIAILVGDKSADNSRTHVDEANNKVCWNEEGEALSVLYTIGTSTYAWRDDTNRFELNPETGGARFNVSLNHTGEGGYTFSAVYPTITTQSMQPELSVPTTQMPVKGSFDPKADLMIASAPATSETAPEQLKFKLKRVVALSKMTLAKLDPGQKVTKVIITATAPEGSAQPYLSGKVKAYLTEYTDADTQKTYPAGSVTYLGPVGYEDKAPYQTITLDLSGYDCIADDKGEITVWFTSMPIVLTGGSLYVEAKTADYTYSRTVDLTGKDLELKVNAINSFGVNLTDKTEGFNGYTIVTNADELQNGAQVIICNNETKPQYGGTPYLLGQESSLIETPGNIIKPGSSSKGYKLVGTVIEEDGISLQNAEGAMVFTLVKRDNNQYALQDKDGLYLYAASKDANNYEIGVQSDPVYWTIRFMTSYDGTHPVSIQSNDLYLSCGSNYSCASSNTNYLYIFQKVGGGSAPEQPAIPEYTFTPNEANYDFDQRTLAMADDKGNAFNLMLMHPEQTAENPRLKAGEYAIVQEPNATTACGMGFINYDGVEYLTVPADNNRVVVSYDDPMTPSLMTVSFTVTAMNENSEPAIFTGTGEYDYGPMRYTFTPNKANYDFDQRTLTLHDDKGNNVNLMLIHPNQTEENPRLIAGEYPIGNPAIAQQLDPTGSENPTGSGMARVIYNGVEYTTGMPAEDNLVVLSYDAANPNLMTVSFAVTVMTEDFETAVFSGEWTGEVNYIVNLASVTNVFDTPEGMMPYFHVTMTGENTSATFDMLNNTVGGLYQNPVLTSIIGTEYYPYVEGLTDTERLMEYMQSEAALNNLMCVTFKASIVYMGKEYTLAPSDPNLTAPETYIKVDTTTEEGKTTIDFKLESKDGLYIFVGSWTGNNPDHTGNDMGSVGGF